MKVHIRSTKRRLTLRVVARRERGTWISSGLTEVPNPNVVHTRLVCDTGKGLTATGVIQTRHKTDSTLRLIWRRLLLLNEIEIWRKHPILPKLLLLLLLLLLCELSGAKIGQRSTTELTRGRLRGHLCLDSKRLEVLRSGIRTGIVLHHCRLAKSSVVTKRRLTRVYASSSRHLLLVVLGTSS